MAKNFVLVVVVALASAVAVRGLRLKQGQVPTAKAQKNCEGEVCVRLMDDIHYRSDNPHTFRNLPALSENLASIRCVRGKAGCKLRFSAPEELAKADGSGKSGSFYEKALKAGTDKVTTHQYHHMYQPLLKKLHKDKKPFGMVEIGFSTGDSAKAWHDWLPNAHLHHFDIGCDENWNIHATAPADVLTDQEREDAMPRAGYEGRFNELKPRIADWPKHRRLTTTTLHCGDGVELKFVEESLANDALAATPQIVVDDGGHSVWLMQQSWGLYWPKVAKGGYFVMEDLEESFHTGGEPGFVETVLKPLVSDLQQAGKAGYVQKLPGVSDNVRSLQCTQGICAIEKMS